MRGRKMARDDCLFNRGVSRHHWRMCARRRASPVEWALAPHRQGEPAVQCHVLLCGRHGLDPGAALSNLVDRRTRGSAQVEHLLCVWVFFIFMPWFTSAVTGRQPLLVVDRDHGRFRRIAGGQPDPALWSATGRDRAHRNQAHAVGRAVRQPGWTTRDQFLVRHCGSADRHRRFRGSIPGELAPGQDPAPA